MENGNLGIKDIAKLADVSIGTIDRVLNNRTGVAPATREKVLQIIKDTGYKKNLVASRLKLAKNKAIKVAVLAPTPRNEHSYWNLPLQGVKRAINELSAMGVSSEYYYFNQLNHQNFREQFDNIFHEEFNALITVPFFESESNMLLSKAKEKNIPVVFLDTERELLYSSNFIRQNSLNAGLVAGRLLHGLVGDEGTYIVVNILNDRGKQINNLQRESGFRSYFKNLPNNKNINHFTINHPLEDDFDLSPELKTLAKGPTKFGIFVTNARSFLLPTILKENKISNYHLIGFDLNKKNTAYLKSGEIDFLINQKPQYQGYTAIKGLYKFLTENDKSQLNIDIPVEIVVKENVDYYVVR
jgi:LacI family transcriptional regulator